MSEPTTLPIDEITVEEGFNVRANGDGNGLADSVRELGVLVPLIVERDDSVATGVRLVAGHRRLTAAREAGRADVPVTFETAERRDSAAAAENISRAGLNPVEEAHAVERLADAGMSERTIQSTLGVSQTWVRRRRKILRVGAGWHPLIATGYVNAEELDLLAAIYEASSELGDLLLAWNEADRHEGCRIDSYAVAGAVADSDFRVLGSDDPKQESLPQEAADKLPTLDKTEYGYTREWSPQWDDDDAKRFEDAGALVTVGASGWRPSYVVTDLDLYRQVLAEKVIAYEPPAKQKAAKKEKKKDDPEAQQRREIREGIKRLQAKARDLNAKLGERLLAGLGEVELTDDVAKYLATAVVKLEKSRYHPGYGGFSPNVFDTEELGHGGLRYVFPDYQKVEERGKAKRQVTVYDEAGRAGEKARKWIAGAATPGQRIGRVLIAAAACEYAIDRVVPQTQRHPSGRVLGDRKAFERIVKPHLPRGIKQLDKKIEAEERKLAALAPNRVR